MNREFNTCDFNIYIYSKYENEEFLNMAYIILPKESSFADMVALNSIGVDSISQEARERYFSFRARNNTTKKQRINIGSSTRKKGTNFTISTTNKVANSILSTPSRKIKVN